MRCAAFLALLLAGCSTGSATMSGPVPLSPEQAAALRAAGQPPPMAEAHAWWLRSFTDTSLSLDPSSGRFEYSSNPNAAALAAAAQAQQQQVQQLNELIATLLASPVVHAAAASKGVILPPPAPLGAHASPSASWEPRQGATKFTNIVDSWPRLDPAPPGVQTQGLNPNTPASRYWMHRVGQGLWQIELSDQRDLAEAGL